MSAPEMAGLGAAIGLNDRKSARQVPGSAATTARSSNHQALPCLSARCAERP
jgi:hypothetical protein